MAHKKAGGSSKNLTDVNPQYLGIKLYGGEKAKPGSIIVRQRGTRFMAGKGVETGKDHTLFAVASGTVAYRDIRKTKFDGSRVARKVVDVK